MLVVVPLVTVRVGVVTGGGVGCAAADALMLAGEPAPAELTALTLKLVKPLPTPENTWLVGFRDVTHGPFAIDTSYLIIAAPPLLAGGDQNNSTWPAPIPGSARKLRGTPGTVAGAVNVIAGL